MMNRHERRAAKALSKAKHALTDDVIPDRGVGMLNALADHLKPLPWPERLERIDGFLLGELKALFEAEQFDEATTKMSIVIASLLVRLDDGKIAIQSYPQAVLYCCANDELRIVRGAAWLEAEHGKRTIDEEKLDGFPGLALLSGMIADEAAAEDQ